MRIQYKIDMTLDQSDTLKVAGALLKVMMRTFKKIKETDHSFGPTDLVFYPLNVAKIAQNKKLILMASKKAEGVLEYLDEKFMKELEKEDLKVIREVF
mgnify:CR=1 FL=1